MVLPVGPVIVAERPVCLPEKAGTPEKKRRHVTFSAAWYIYHPKMEDQGRDQAFFMRLYAPVHERFARFCKARAYGDMEYQDLMHDTIELAYQKLHAYEPARSFLHFLFGIAIRVLANANRKKRTLQFKDHQGAFEAEDPATRADRFEDHIALYAALKKLPEPQRDALILFEISGFSIAEIADLQGAGISAVKQRLVRGRQHLTEILKEEVDEFKRTQG